MNNKLERKFRALQIYNIALTGALAFVVSSGFQNSHQKMKELDVERINIVEPDGTLRMTISNKERVPEPRVGGRTFTGARHGQRSAGMIFFNEKGDECGGLGFGGNDNDNKIAAGADLMFDQFDQDQTVGISYSQSGGDKSAGLHVWDRPSTPLPAMIDRKQAIDRMPEGPQKRAEMERLKQAAAAGEFGMHRMFVGRSPDGSVGVNVADRRGKTRIALKVDADNMPHLEFLDDSGKVVYSVPAQTR